MMTTKYEVQVCYKKSVIWEGLVIANNTVDAQAQAIAASDVGFGIAMYDYINIDHASDASVWSKLN